LRLCRRFVPRSEVVTRVDEKNAVYARECIRQGRSIREIPDLDIDAVAEESSRLLHVPHQDARPSAALEQALYDKAANIPVAPVMR